MHKGCDRPAIVSSSPAKRLKRESALYLAAVACLAQCGVALANPSDASYRLVFADEFNGTSLDTAKWSAASPSWTMPNSASTATASEVSVANGAVTLNATRTASSFTSGSISSYQKYNFAGGYAEARINLPSTPGSWPAFWGLYTGWPPEIDIMEYPLTTDGSIGMANNQYNTSYHYTNSNGNAAAGAGGVTAGSNLGTSGYHIFAMDWVAGTSVKFYLDGAQVSSYTGSSVAQMVNMYMILDYAVGGWPGTPTTAQWAVGQTDQTVVDYVHVWQKNSGGDAPSNWNINGGGAFGTGGNWTAGTPMYGNQTAIFGRVGAAASATVTLNSWHVVGGLTFDGMTTGALAGTTAYTIGTNSSQIQLATTSGSAVVQATSASTANQVVGARLELWSNSTFKNDMAGGQTLNFNSEISGSGTLTITGAGTSVINASSTYTGGTNVGSNQEAAVLQASADGALGTGGVVIGPGGNASTARLEVTGSHILPNTIDFRGRTNNSAGIRSISGNNILDGTITGNAGGNIYQIQSDAGTLTLRGAASAGVALQAGSGARTFTLQGASSGVVSGRIQNGGGTVSVFKDGTGMWTLAGSNAYTGLTTVNAGTLAFSTSPSSAAGISVANGANLRIQAAGVNTTTLTATSLALGSGGTTAMTFDFNSLDTIAPLSNVGAMTVNGPVTVTMQNSGVLLSGTHTLVGYTSSSGAGSFTGSPFTLGPRSTGTLVSNGTSALNLVVSADRPIWTGLDGSNWQAGSTGANKNWKLQVAAAATDYLAGDNVLFDDSAAGTSNVNITGASISAAAVHFNNATRSYIVASSGGFGITGTGPVNKSGAGTVTFATANTYTGLTTLSGGTLSISANNHLGDNTAPVLMNGGTLRTTAGITNGHAFTFGAAGGTLNVSTVGQYYFHTPNTLLGVGPLTLTGNGTLTVNTGNLRIDQTNTYAGAVTLTSGGIFEYGTAGAVSTAATFNIGNQGELAIQGFASTDFPNSVTVSGGTNSVLSFENSTTGEMTGPITLNANLTVGLRDWYNYAAVRGGTISGVMSGTGGITVNSGSGTGGTLTLNSANTFTGNIVVTAATVLAANGSNTGAARTSGPLGNTTTAGKTVTINSGGVVSFTKGNTLGGGAVLTAPAMSFIINAGGILKTATTDIGGPGAGDANIFGNITLTGGTFTTGNGYSADWPAAIMLGSISVSGSSASTINTNASSTAGNGLALGGAVAGTNNVFFNIADATNSSATDLTVSAPLWNSAASDTNPANVGALTKTGAGTMALTTINTYDGGTTISGGTLLLSAGGSAGAIRGTLSIGTGTTVKLTTADALGYSAGTSVTTINITGGTLDNGAAGNNGYAASWVLTGGLMSSTGGGTFHINAGGGRSISSLASATISTISAPVAIRGGNSVLPISVADGTAATDLLMSGIISNSPSEAGVNGIQKTGPGTLVLSASNSFTGTTTISAGTLQLGNGATNGALSPSSSIIDNATLAFNRSNTMNQGSDFANAITGSGGIAKFGAGTLILGGTNTYAGPSTIAQGLLSISGLYSPALTSGTTLSVVSTGQASVGGTASFFTVNSPGSDVIVNGTLNINSTSTSNVSTVQKFTGAGTVTLDKGTLNSSAGARVGGLQLTNGAMATIALTDADGAGAGVQGSAAGVSKLTGLSVDATSRLDLTNNALIIPGSGTLNGSAISVATLRAAVIAGRGSVGTGGATWSGAGGIGSSAFTLESANSLGYVWNADPDLLILGGITGVNGETLTGSDYAVKFTRAGDANLDGIVDNIDVGIIGLRYLSTLGNQWYQGDFNYDGVVNNDDVAILGLAYAPGASPLSPDYRAPLAAEFGGDFALNSVVPEPASLGLLAAGTLGLLRRRAR